MKAQSLLLTLTAMIFLCFATHSQQAENRKIIVKITKEIDGEKKTFKGEYNSTKEMYADPDYQEFAGDEHDFNFWFDGDGEEDVFLHLDQLGDQGHSVFKFFGDEEDQSNSFFYKHFDEDSTDSFFNLHLDDMNMEEFREHMKKLGVEMDKMLNRLDEEDGKRHLNVFTIKRVKITDVDGEFGKKGKVDESSLLELEDLHFYPNPSPNGRFKVQFSVPVETNLNIKVSNIEGKEVFSRRFEIFSGLYSEMIDLSGQKDGVYLLEIYQGKKRLTKKIIIN